MITRFERLHSYLTGEPVLTEAQGWFGKLFSFWSSREPASATGGVATDPERRLGRAQMALAQAQADYAAAKQIWPRDRAAVAAAWDRFRDARCALISAEIGR